MDLTMSFRNGVESEILAPVISLIADFSANIWS